MLLTQKAPRKESKTEKGKPSGVPAFAEEEKKCIFYNHEF